MVTPRHTPLPGKLATSAAAYDGQTQRPVEFRAATWRRTLASVPSGLGALLDDDRYTAPVTDGRGARAGERTVTRDAVLEACAGLDLEDADRLLQAWVLAVVWGSGKTNGRAHRYLPESLRDPARAAHVLRSTATALRSLEVLEPTAIETAYRSFGLPGVGPSFFTKWFAFAGHVTGRGWQPLILDERVVASLNRTLGVRLADMTDRRGPAPRYAAYVQAIHWWADDLTGRGSATTADRLEWVLFEHDGRPLPT